MKKNIVSRKIYKVRLKRPYQNVFHYSATKFALTFLNFGTGLRKEDHIFFRQLIQEQGQAHFRLYCFCILL